MGDPGFDPWVRKILWRRKWQPTLVFLPGKFHGWRILIGYSPWGHKESDTTEWLHFHFVNREYICIFILNFLRLVVKPSLWPILVNAYVHLKKGVCSAVIGCCILQMSVKSSFLIVLFRSFVFADVFMRAVY